MTAFLAALGATALILVVGLPTGGRRRAVVPAPLPLAFAPTASWSVRRLVDRLLPSRRHHRRDAQLPDALERLASAMRSGLALGPALGQVATTTADPLGTELRPVTLALEGGVPVADALAGWSTAAGASRDVQLVVAALTLGAVAGGEVARAVDGIAGTLRERRAVHAEVRALATQARTSAGVLAVAPIAFAALVTTVEPRAVAFLVASPLGLVCLLLGLGLEGLGAVWMTRITASVS